MSGNISELTSSFSRSSSGVNYYYSLGGGYSSESSRMILEDTDAMRGGSRLILTCSAE